MRTRCDPRTSRDGRLLMKNMRDQIRRTLRPRRFLALSFRCLVLFVAVPAVLGLALDHVCSRMVACARSAVGTFLEETPLLRVPPVPGVVLDSSALPLRVSGRWLLDRQGKHVRLRCVNWYGAHLNQNAFGGLDVYPVSALAHRIRDLGFNCVRLPYSLDFQMKARPPRSAVRANPALWNASGLQVLDATVSALTDVGLLVVLNNHQGRTGWCCSEDDGEGLWYTADYPESVWFGALGTLASRYRDNLRVCGYDLRNELRGVPSGSGYKRPQWDAGPADVDWADAASRGAVAVSVQDPSALIFVEGLSFGTDLSGLRKGGRLHERPELRGRIVYSAHDYTWYHPELRRAWFLHWLALGWTSCLFFEHVFRRPTRVAPSVERLDRSFPCYGAAPKPRPLVYPKLAVLLACILCWIWSYNLASYRHYEEEITSRWGFLLDGNEAPVWVGEFGTNGPCVTDAWWMEIGEVTWWSHAMRYMREHEVDYAYWALNGDKNGEEETFGVLDREYSSVRHPWLLQELP